MKGYMTIGEDDYHTGFNTGRENGAGIMFHLTITVDGVNRFVTDPDHDTTNLTGYIECEALGGRLPLEEGVFNLFVDDADPSVKRMFYRLFFSDDQGNPLTLTGYKLIKDDPGFDLWQDTTTLYTRILKGHITAQQEEALNQDRAALAAALLGSGIIVIPFFSFLKQLTTFRAEGPSFSDRAAALARFGRLFMGKLWDVYAREVLSSGPF
jgi:hypothetical protein